MVFTQWISTYGNVFFGVGAAVAAAVSVLMFITAFIIVCILSKRTPSTINDASTFGCLCMGFVALLLVCSQILWTLAMATLNGGGLLGASTFGGLYLAAVVPLIVSVPLTVAALSPRIWKGQHNTVAQKGRCVGILSFTFSAAVRAAGLKPQLVWSTTVAALVLSALAFIGLSGLCYCSNPQQVSSWASRRVDAPICIAGTICHSYLLLGETPDTLTLVLQWVDGLDVAAVQVTVCEVADSTTAFDTSKNMQLQNCSTAPVTLPSADVTFFPYFYLSEDQRHIAHATLRGLKSAQGYKVEARLLDGTNFATANLAFPLASVALHVKTMPSLSPAAPEASANITFVGGGDYYMGQAGTETLMAALQLTPDAAFIFIGGDMSYANNMRTCYRRWDQFFVELTRARTNARGWSLPLLIMPGNHESGGYVENDGFTSHVGGDADHFHFYLQYFPYTRTRGGMSAALNTGSTASYFHAHEIGPRLGLLMLDSGCFVKIEDQLQFVQDTLGNWTAASPRRLPVPMFHVPAFPGRSRPSSADAESRADLKALLVPLFDRYNVSVAFQYHEHVYFRSQELDVSGAPLSAAALAAGQRGITYLGDGAMGVAGKDRVAMESGSLYSHVTYSSVNFAYSVTFDPTTWTLDVKAASPTSVDVKNDANLGKLIDVFAIKPRW